MRGDSVIEPTRSQAETVGARCCRTSRAVNPAAPPRISKPIAAAIRASRRDADDALCHQVGDMQPPRDRPVGLCGEGCAQSLALLRILSPLLPQLGMECEIGIERLGALGR
jgi:hypothetical protein